MAYTYPKGLIPMTAGWVKNNPADNTVMGVADDMHGGFKVRRNQAEMLTLHPNYLLKDYTACFVLDNDGAGTPALYYLSSVPTNTDSTVIGDWTKWEGPELPGGLRFAGLLDPSSYTLTDADPSNAVGDFWIVDTTQAPATINDPNLLNGVSTDVYNNDWLIFNEDLGYFEHIDRTAEFITTWAEITQKPQVIKDIENEIIFDHEHDASDVNVSVTLDGTPYSKLDQLLGLIVYTNKIASDIASATDDQLLNYGDLKLAFSTSDEVDTKISDALVAWSTNYYTKTEVDNAIANSTANPDFDWDRPIKKELKIGDTLGGTKLTEGLEKLFDHIEPDIEPLPSLKIKRGVITDLSVTFNFIYNEATEITAITIYDASDDSLDGTVSPGLGDPSAIVTINGLVLNTGESKSYYAVMNYKVGGDTHSKRIAEFTVNQYVPVYAGGLDTAGVVVDFDLNLTEIDPEADEISINITNQFLYIVIPVASVSGFLNNIIDLDGTKLDGDILVKSASTSVSITTPDNPYSEDFYIYESSYKTSYDDKLHYR